MSIRWRSNGELICAAISQPEEEDTYIDDRLHYQLSVISKAIIADVNHEVNGLWHWVHSETRKLGLRCEDEGDVLDRLNTKTM